MSKQVEGLEILDSPPLTDELEVAKEHLDIYGMALIK